MMIGQQHIVDELTKYSLENLPKTILLLGESGSEQFDVAKEVANHFNLELVTITTDDLVLDDSESKLMEYAKYPIDRFYYINLPDFSFSAAGGARLEKILKYLEQPPMYMHFILEAESTIGLKDTLLNRCRKFTCAPYSEAQLKECEWMVRNPNELVYKICKTPGQLADVDGDQIQALFTLCDKVVSQVKKASYANTLTLVAKVNCDKDETKFDFYQFFNTLEYVSFKKYIETKDIDLYKLYMYINKTKQYYLNKKIAKEAFMLNFLDGLWRLEH